MMLFGKFRIWILALLFIFITGFNNSVKSQVLISLLFGDVLNSPNVEFGLDGGFNYSNIRGFESNSTIRKFNLGFYFDIRLKNNWYINPSVLVKADHGIDNLTRSDLIDLGVDSLEASGDYRQYMGYFNVPIQIKYRFNNGLFFEAGPMLSLLHNAKIEYTDKREDTEIRIQTDNRDDLNRIDAGIIGGAGYKFKKGLGMSLGLRYYYGLSEVYKELNNRKNQSAYLFVTIPIGAGGEKKEDEN